VVDPSLLRLAADRGVTICFADLDGADGLWVPEERTVLVDRRLSERQVAEVIEHELGHVAIDDQHADLDAAVGRPPPPSSRRWAAALTAAACLAVVGGVTAGLTLDDSRGGIREDPVVAPTAQPLTAGPPPSVPGGRVDTSAVSSGGPLSPRTGARTGTVSATAPAATSTGRGAPTATGPSAAPAPPAQPTRTTPAPVTTGPGTSSPPQEPTTAPTASATTPPEVPGDEVDQVGDATGSATTDSDPTGTP